MSLSSEERYLQLMKKALSFSLWPEPPIPLETFNYQRSAVTRLLIEFATWMLHFKGISLVQHRRYTDEARARGQILPMHADTMIDITRRNSGLYRGNKSKATSGNTGFSTSAACSHTVCISAPKSSI